MIGDPNHRSKMAGSYGSADTVSPILPNPEIQMSVHCKSLKRASSRPGAGDPYGLEKRGDTKMDRATFVEILHFVMGLIDRE